MFNKVQGISYSYGGRECSLWGLKRLSNEQECAEAVKYVKSVFAFANYLGVVNSPDFPTGCYKYPLDYPLGRMYFNSHPNGHNDHFPSMDTICKKGIKSFRIHILNNIHTFRIKVKDIYQH